MTTPQPELSFKAPPLIEVSFSIQFEPIENFHLGFIGLTWNTFRDRYPNVEIANQLPHQIEKFGVISRKRPPSFTFQEETEVPRLLIVSEDSQYIIQIQKDRFIFNWRNFENLNEYPRYPQIKKKVLGELGVFTKFLADSEFAPPTINQIEVTYINHIDATNRSIEDIFKDVVVESGFSPSLTLEAFSINLKHLITREETKVGRLYTAIEKASRVADGSEIYVLKFVARVHPAEPSIAGLNSSMDIAREEINNSFRAITTIAMHEEWNKEREKK